jgi:sugar phosphate isomerase/epimerase
MDRFLKAVSDSDAVAVCMRASAAGVKSFPDYRIGLCQSIEDAGLAVSMVTADSDVPLNNDRGPMSLQNIGPSLDVAESLNCDLIRVCLKTKSDIKAAQKATDEAAERGIRLAHQLHTATIFEEVDQVLSVLKKIDRENFGIIYEPANLMVNGQSYGVDTVERLAPHIMNVYVQNHCLNPEGADSLETYCRGEVRFDHLPLWGEGGVDFSEVFKALKKIDYDGYFTIHQAQGVRTPEDAAKYINRCQEFVAQYQ